MITFLIVLNTVLANLFGVVFGMWLQRWLTQRRELKKPCMLMAKFVHAPLLDHLHTKTIPIIYKRKL